MIRISFPALTILTSRLAVRAGLAHTAEARRTAFMRNSLFPSHLVAAHPRGAVSLHGQIRMDDIFIEAVTCLSDTAGICHTA